jgi:acyl-CoA dehydrogenase
MIDFEIPAETRALRERVRRFVQEVCLPAERELETRPAGEILKGLQEKARAEGLWCAHMPKEWGGMGLGPLANAVIQIEMAGSHLAARAMNSEGPDDATMLTILEHGTEAQKEKYLRPLVEGEARICFSMTEKAAGADATGMRTTAVLDGDH